MVLKWIGYYKLTKENIEKYVPVGGGIYRIAAENENDSTKVKPPIYIGQSKNLEDRMFQYLNEDTDNKCLLGYLQDEPCYFIVAEVGKQTDRDAGERALYDEYEPECNDPDKIPNVEPADINFNN